MFQQIVKGFKSPKTVISILWQACSRLIISDKLYLKVYYYLHTGEKLHLKTPVTFTEKTQWLKLHNNSTLCTQMADKYGVREIVKEKVGKQYLIPMYGVWDRFEEIDFDTLPNQFVLKTTHDSGSVVICKDKDKLDIEQAKRKLNKSLSHNYFWNGREYPYRRIQPRIIAEKYMSNDDGKDISDYKFFCFNGKPEILFYASDRFNKDGERTKFDYYNMDLEHLSIQSRGHKNSNAVITISEQLFSEMKDLAAKLSSGFPFLRVDLYLINDKIYFGELTFHHDGGVVPFIPSEWNKILGDKIIIQNK